MNIILFVLVYNTLKSSTFDHCTVIFRPVTTADKDQCSWSKITGMNIIVLWSKVELSNTIVFFVDYLIDSDTIFT